MAMESCRVPIHWIGEKPMKRIIPLLQLPVLILTGCTAPKASASSYRQVSMQEAIEIMASENKYIILDVRTIAEYESGHIPGAICVPNETIASTEFPELPDKNQLILVYCRSGNRSKQAAGKLAKIGYTNVVEFDGINSWPGEIVSE